MKLPLYVSLLVAFCSSVFTSFGQHGQEIIIGNYHGLGELGGWTYSFKKNMIFSCSTAGHYGYFTATGKFSISGDTIYIKSSEKRNKKSNHFMAITDTLLIQGDSCLIDLSRQYKYCKIDKIKYKARWQIAYKN